MTSSDIRKKFLNFFIKRGHIVVSSSSLLSDDPSVLLTTAGVQQFKSYYTSALNPEKYFNSRRVVSVQKCFRTSDIDEVGDKTHLTFFEMLGNFSFGDYYKREAIKWGYEFITKELGVDEKRVSVSIFKGEDGVSRDDESYNIWFNEVGINKKKIKEAGMDDNFWGPTGNNGPCGPTTEIYVDGIEIWNIVFNEYFCEGSRDDLLSVPPRHSERAKRVEESHLLLKKLNQPGVDTGMGLERLVAVLNGTDNVFETDNFALLISLLSKEISEENKRILTDHIRGIAFLIADGVRPSNKEAGYILRRLIRRVITISNKSRDLISILLGKVIELYQDNYPELKGDIVIAVFEEESQKFGKTLDKGIKELGKLKTIDARLAFKLFETFGLPYEVIKDVAGSKAKKLKREDFDKEFTKHQQLSRVGLEKKFGGHGLLLDTGELKAADKEEMMKVTRLHTATHLLQQALRDVLGDEARQRGSDINNKRTRFDFSFQRKLNPEETRRVEQIVNEKIKKDLLINFKEMPLEEAKKTGALFLAGKKYPDPVKIYYIGKNLKTAYSKELCGGPHVSRTGEIGKFKILKEEGIGAGLRRIRATIEN